MKHAKNCIEIIETPRDAMQGLQSFIPTYKKIEYINSLLKIGFDIVEAGSFVSHAAVPQMHDTAEVLKGLKLDRDTSKIMVLIANVKGFDIACQFDEINCISYPYSASPTFLLKNIRKQQAEAVNDIEYFLNKSLIKNKELIVYLTMAFGNPYNDFWSPEIIASEIEKLKSMGVLQISLSDITAEADSKRIEDVFRLITREFPDLVFGLHLHSEPGNSTQLIHAAYSNGCRRFDTVINGLGGCPMTGKELLANLNTFQLIDYANYNDIPNKLNQGLLAKVAEKGFL